MAKKFTPIGIEAIKPTANRQEIADAAMPGLYLIVQPSGKKSWAVRFQGKDGKSKKLTIGAWPETGIADAHKAATDIKLKLREGVDPHAESMLAKAGTDEEKFEWVAADFVKRHIQVKNKGSTQYEHTRLLNTELVSVWTGKKIKEITLRDIDRVLQAKFDEGHGTTANRMLSLISKLLNWAKGKGYVTVNIAEGLDKPAEEKARTRYLNREELRLVWLAADRIGYPFGDVVKLLILTGQRRDEVARMEWRELDLFNNFYGPRFVVPDLRAKNGLEAVIPLTEAALKIIKKAPKLAPTGKEEAVFVFTHDGNRPVRGYTKNKAKLDKTVLEIMKEEAIVRGEDPAKVKNIPHWILHDLRRTFSSLGPEDLNLTSDVVDAIQNHAKKGMAKHYNQGPFIRQKEDALNLWAQYVEAVAAGKRFRVVIPKATIELEMEDVRRAA